MKKVLIAVQGNPVDLRNKIAAETSKLCPDVSVVFALLFGSDISLCSYSDLFKLHDSIQVQGTAHEVSSEFDRTILISEYTGMDV